jgi:hypothetical protein
MPSASSKKIRNLVIVFTAIERPRHREPVCGGQPATASAYSLGRTGEGAPTDRYLLAFTTTLPVTVSGSPWTFAAMLS